jgi:hypothetical protein
LVPRTNRWPRPVDDAPHHRDLQRDLPGAEGLHGALGHVDDIDLGAAA